MNGFVRSRSVPSFEWALMPSEEANRAICIKGCLKRFHNSRALSDTVQGGIFLRKMPLESFGFGVQQLWNRCSPTITRESHHGPRR